MSKRYILAIDQSTSGTKAQLITDSGEVVIKRSRQHRQYYPQPGWVEHDPLEIYRNVTGLIAEVAEASAAEGYEIVSLAITNQRETVVVWDRATGEPVYPAIVWQCRRTAELCETWKAQGKEAFVQARTGLTLDPYFSATKIKWVLDDVPGARAKAENGQLLFGTMDSWLIWKLTDGRVHATDYTNASRTLLFNIFRLEWDTELLELFDIPSAMLPKVKYADEVFGHLTLNGRSLPIAGVIGDSHGALLGQRCFRPGMVKATYGTGSSLMMNTGDRAVSPALGLTTTIAYACAGKVHYALEGIIHSTGDTLKWMQDQLGLFTTFQEAEEMAASLPGNDGVYLIPSFSGLGAPYWKPHMRASIIGLTRRADKKHLVRAGMESISYQIADVLELMRQVSGVEITELRVDGGPTANRFLMQFQADIARVQVVRTEVPELSAMGAAYMSGLATGVWSWADLDALPFEKQAFRPEMERGERDRLYREWKRNLAEMVGVADRTLSVPLQ